MIQIHLVIAALFLPLLLMMPVTGSLYILGFKGDQTKVEAFRIQEVPPKDENAQEEFFRAKFKEQNLDYDFEYIRGNGKEFTFRPVTNVHYVAAIEGESLVFSQVNPTLLKRMIELHKGHGPTLMRWFEVAFGVALVLVTLSGMWLALTVPVYRKLTFVSFAIGVAIIAICMV